MSESIDQNTVQIDRRTAELWQKSTALLDRMLGDPSTAPQAEDLIKKVNPDAVFPGRASREALMAPVNEAIERVKAESRTEIDAALALAKATQDRLDAREARETETAQSAREQATLDQIRQIQARRGFSEETMQKVLDRMREQNNPDVESAAAWVAESIPKPLPASGHDFLPSTVDVYGSASDPAGTMWEKLHENPTQWQTNELRSIVRDPEFLRLGQ